MKASLLVAIIGAMPSVFAAAAPVTLSNTITLSEGTIRGNARDANGVLSFLGIPYAEPPTGNLRWHSPQAGTRWSGTRNATAFGSTCYASSALVEQYFTPPSEDCLFINVWTNAQTASANLPVMVWIPGGGFQFGGAAQPTWGGAPLAGEDVVIVSINYRLALFGFLALTDLDAEGTPSGNFGLQDQLLALKWVQNNIAAFGGNPDKVTIFGQSAGGHSVGLLMASPLSYGLFNQAILQSGSFWDSEAGPLASFAQARQRGSAFMAKVGATSVAQLRAMPAETINAAAPWNPFTDPKIYAFSPSVDYYIAYSSPGSVFANNMQREIPVLSGFTSEEGLLFAPYGLPTTSAAAYQAVAAEYFDSFRIPQFLSLFPDTTQAQLVASQSALTGDMVIQEQTYTAYDLHFHSILSPPVWAYYYTYASPYSPVPIHTAELPFVFGNLLPNTEFGPDPAPASARDVAFSKALMTYWTNFAKTGNPNGAGVPTWPAYAGSGTGVLQLGDAIVSMTLNVAGLDFIRSYRMDGVLPADWVNVNVRAPLS